MTLTLRYMRLDDIPTVVMIDTVSFDPSWSARSYSFEITDSNYSHMLVLEQTRAPVQAASERHNRDNGRRSRGLGNWLREMGASVSAAAQGDAQGTRELVGYGGMWIIADEAHISTIASHPQHRGRGFGELMLAAMIRKAIAMQAAYIVLEVRVSNVVAQRLYAKYGFQIVDTKQNYYHTNNEDGYDMRLLLSQDPAYVAQFLTRCDEMMARAGIVDAYTMAERTRI